MRGFMDSRAALRMPGLGIGRRGTGASRSSRAIDALGDVAQGQRLDASPEPIRRALLIAEDTRVAQPSRPRCGRSDSVPGREEG